MDSVFSLTRNDDTSTEETYGQIDKAIEKHQISILALRSRRNAMAPISRLPPEIFCNIFLFVKARRFRFGRNTNTLTWVKLTHVSRHWRNIAVNSSNLWVDLPVRHFGWTEKMLNRSIGASLIIEASFGPTDGVPPGLELAFKHSPRIKDLSLSFVLTTANLTIWDQLSKHLPASVPRLETLAILWGDSGYPNSDLDAISIPEHALCKMDRLRHLELINCNVNWSSHLHQFHSLTHLILHGLSKTSRLTGQQFLDALNGMHHLELLSLQEALPIRTAKQMSWASGHIHFALLQTLNIRSTDAEVESFFSCVTFPPKTTAKVVVFSTVNTQATARNSIHGENSSSIILSLARSYSNPSSAKTFNTIVLANPEEVLGPGVQLRLFEDTLTMEEMGPHFTGPHFTRTPLLELVFVYNDSIEQAVANVMTDLFSGALPLRHVKQVYLEDTIPGIEPKTMVNTIGVLPRVHFIMVGFDACKPFLDAAEHIRAVHSHSESAEITLSHVKKLYFCSLRSLCLYHTTFSDPEPSLSDSGDITIEMLQDFLIHRYEYGMEMRQLTLRYCCGLSGKEVDLLAEIVVDMDWNGEEITDDEDGHEDDDSHEDYEDEYYDSDEDYF